jgi:hypothetical protein
VSYARFGRALGGDAGAASTAPPSAGCFYYGFYDLATTPSQGTGQRSAPNPSVCAQAGGTTKTVADPGLLLVDYWCCCGAGKEPAGNQCLCPAGKIADENGACVSVFGEKKPEVVLQTCKPDEKWSDADSACVVASCPTGLVWDSGAWACVTMAAAVTIKGGTVVQPKGGGTPYVERPRTAPPQPFFAAGFGTRAAPWAIGAMLGLAAATLAFGARRA